MQLRRQRGRLRQFFDRDEVPFQRPGGLGIDVHRDVGKRHVDEQHLRIGRGHCFDRDAIVLLLVDEFDAV